MGISYQKSWKTLKRKRRCTLHAGMVSEGFVNFIPKNDRTANSGDVNPLKTIWIIVNETTNKDLTQNTGRAKTVTTLRLKNANLDTPWELVHSIPHHSENVRKHKGRHSGF